MIYLIIAICFVLAVVVMVNLSIYIKAKSNHLDLGLFDIVMMRLRSIPPGVIVDHFVKLQQSGVEVDSEGLQNHYLKGGDVLSVSEAAISAYKSKIDVGFDRLCKIDLAGRDVLEAVDSYVRPKVISCPDRKLSLHEDGRIVAVASDGIRLGVSVKVTVRADINKLIGSAGELTLMARVQECVLSAVGRVLSHKEVLNNPGLLIDKIMQMNVVRGTSYILVSADVAEVVVLDNLKAKLDAVQSEADRKVAEARASAAQAEAKATQQEMKARMVEMRASVLLSKSRLPAAMSDSMSEGSVGSSHSPIKNAFEWRIDGL
jgi:uncharacterized protein YqfA (UPF0365 family)